MSLVKISGGGTFRFAKVFPESKKAEYFSKKERALSGDKKPPEEVLVRDHIWVRYNLHKGSGRVTGRKIFPFSVEEQLTLTTAITDHWKPYFRSAFTIGLREGEQIGLKPRDIDWSKKLLHVRRAITLDVNGNKQGEPE